MAEPLVIAGREIPPASRVQLGLPVVRRPTRDAVEIPVEVVHGARPGPRLFVCSAIHGDEINGVEIVRRLLRRRRLARLRGALIAAPVVNVYGFLAQSRTLPDRRDLNRCFPGSASGSLAARLADVFMREVVEHCTHGIDLHTGSRHRTNLPQIRACLDDPETERLARAFGVPVVLDANLRDGSLRQAVLERHIPVLLYEGGEALRFDERAIRAGMRGILNVMRALDMLPPGPRQVVSPEPYVARSSHWLRAPESGILLHPAALGAPVEEGASLGLVSDPLGERETPVLARADGVVIGRTELPLVNEGDALFHVATFSRPARVADLVESFQGTLDEPAPE